MKIQRVETFRLHPRAIKEAWSDDEYVWPSRLPSFLVKVITDDGQYGIGEATSQTWYLGETAEQIEAGVRAFDGALHGSDAENFALAHQIMEATVSGGMPGGRTARSGVDMALYDLVGKGRGVPVHALLGGAYRREFELLTNLYFKTPESMAAACEKFVGQGFMGLKIKVGDLLLTNGWSRATIELELAKLEAALTVVPRSVYVDADANQAWESAKWTVALLRRFEQHDNLSIEQPLPYADLHGAAFIRAHSPVPVILDESVWSPRQMMHIIERGACDRIVLKLNRLGGFFPSLQVVSMCEAAGIGVSVDTNPYTLVGDTAVCHIAAVVRNPYPVDCEGHVSFLTLGEEPLFQGGVRYEGGRAILPDRPGLGIDVDWDALARHSAEGIESR